MKQPDVVIVKYNAGNLQSVLFALERLGVEGTVTDDHKRIQEASHVIFPGVGAANSAMPYLRERGLDDLLRCLQQPFLGICLGMQLMCAYSEEGDTGCLGIFDVPVKKFEAAPGIKIPHMGWNPLSNLNSPLLRHVKEGDAVYFVHSYYAPLHDATIAQSNHGVSFTAAMSRDNFYGVQFHTEKSARVGEQILQNFLAL